MNMQTSGSWTSRKINWGKASGGMYCLGRRDVCRFLLGDVSTQTTEQYLGCKQRLRNAVNDKIGLEPTSS